MAVRLSLLPWVIVALAACGSDRASEEDLAAQFERLQIPAAAAQVGESYEECPADANDMTVCPILHRWYEIEGDIGPVKDRIEALTEEGFQIDVDSDTTMVTDGDYSFFVTFGVGARDAGEAPESADLEVEVSRVPDF